LIEVPLIEESFPSPDSESLEVSRTLVERIRAEIEAGDGWLSFERFMQLALHEPGLGYYSAGAVKLGPAGDFTTAPELSGCLAAALAPLIRSALGEIGSRRILELGAGSGKLAGQLMSHLDADGTTGIEYSILETSADLRERQQTELARWSGSTRWLDRVPAEPFAGIVVANEVVDALPVARFEKTGDSVVPLGVTWQDDRLLLAPGPRDEVLSEAVARIERELGTTLPEGFRSEICLMLGPWLEEILGVIDAGGVLLIDYGMPRRDYYRPERADGTLMCHYRHRAHTDPLLWPGLQDITAWVDFTAVAHAARELGFSIAGFTTQAQFLVETISSDPALAAQIIAADPAGAMRRLVLPGEMGERFKLIWLTKGAVSTGLPGRDFRNWL
jgi:SAM-dependent MidA family methyltransferase